MVFKGFNDSLLFIFSVVVLTTLEIEPDKFFYYNNGITVVCDKAVKKERRGRAYLQVSNPQIINGQQTTRVLASHPTQAGKVSVLVKVIEVPRDPDNHQDVFDGMVSRIVAGTNWQNAITKSDLMSNDRKQIEIERNLRCRGYVYLRKRQTKAETKRLMGGKGKVILKKETLAQASTGCEMDPHLVRSGKEHLFDEHNYQAVFPNTDPDYYLPRYWLMNAVSYSSRGTPDRAYAKWMVLNFAWSHLGRLVRRRKSSRQFVELYERDAAALVKPLFRSLNRIFVAAHKFYRAYRGTGNEAIDPSQFYRNKKGRHTQFARFWNKNTQTKDRKRFLKEWKKVSRAIRARS